MFSRLTNKVVSMKIWRIVREESECMTNTDEGCEWTMFWGQCSLFEVAEAVRKLVKSLESCFPAKRVTVVVFLWYCPKTMVSLLLSKSRKYHLINLTDRVNFVSFNLKISFIWEQSVLESSYKLHYDCQNISPLANGTNLNWQMYAILQTHWH